MNRTLAALVLATPLFLAGCSSHEVQPERVYSKSEIKSFAVELLGASSISRENYAKYRRALSEPSGQGSGI
ncbi:hypothetical protein [Pseudomonas schmalbachii]|uniref:Lipoprotein n=1 Tax=Pseudomonas schmalbachii TaxID=2816993 RepID=A0ABS3TV69_9PSED|nr:hypothetical protein [Pseudomonas schmalbachii]MBO3276570.1 hypothetical protein [Pseudomonas schmalbachii]